MSLTEDMVLDYLINVPSLKEINNHNVKDKRGDKTGQMPLTIEIGKQLIDEILEDDSERDIPILTEDEENALINLKEALNSLPTFSIFSLPSLMKVDKIQNALINSVNNYLSTITQFEEHELLLKAVVLVLKIIEYDLSKKPGPMTFFSVEVLSDGQRIENHIHVKKLLTSIIEQFDMFYEKINTTDTESRAEVCYT